MIKFDLSGNPDNRAAKTVSLQIGGVTHSFFYDPAAKANQRNNMKYEEMEVTFTATGTTTLISFIGNNANGAWGASIDNVRMFLLNGGNDGGGGEFASGVLAGFAPGPLEWSDCGLDATNYWELVDGTSFESAKTDDGQSAGNFTMTYSSCSGKVLSVDKSDATAGSRWKKYGLGNAAVELSVKPTALVQEITDPGK